MEKDKGIMMVVFRMIECHQGLDIGNDKIENHSLVHNSDDSPDITVVTLTP